MKRTLLVFFLACICAGAAGAALPYMVVDTGQDRCYDNSKEISYPSGGGAFYGQDAQYQGVQPSYRDNGNGTVSDLNTGLTWVKEPSRMTYAEAVAGAAECREGGYTDWRLPTIKELYSLMDFRGIDPDPGATDTGSLRPFIDTDHFGFSYGDLSSGRLIDSQFVSATIYAGTTMGGNKTVFGVNAADGRIKGYPAAGTPQDPGGKKFQVRYVRGNPAYGHNKFKDNGDGTVTDRATGLTWQKADSGRGMDWKDALSYAESLQLAGHDDWRLPNAKELQSIVDYSRSPSVTGSAAIDPVFAISAITNEAGQKDYPAFWTGTTHVSSRGGEAGVYLSFGRAMGHMRDRWIDVHGAGAQRSDPKAGDPGDYPNGRGPQGDAIRIFNYVRCVRGGTAEPRKTGPAVREQKTAVKKKLKPGSRFNGNGGGMRQGQQGMPGGRGQRGMGPGSGGNRPGLVEHLDRDGDGRVSREEFDGPADQFDVLDRDGDGYLSESEAPPPPRGGRSGRPRRGPGLSP